MQNKSLSDKLAKNLISKGDKSDQHLGQKNSKEAF